MKSIIIIILIITIASISLFESCENSLGLDNNVRKIFKEPDFENIDFLPKLTIGKWYIIEHFLSDSNGNRIGGTIMCDTFRIGRLFVKNNKECIGLNQIAVYPGSVSRMEYGWAIEGSVYYRDVFLPNSKHLNDNYGGKPPQIRDTTWLIAADFSKKSWIYPDTLVFINEPLKWDVTFTGKVSFRGELGG